TVVVVVDEVVVVGTVVVVVDEVVVVGGTVMAVVVVGVVPPSTSAACTALSAFTVPLLMPPMDVVYCIPAVYVVPYDKRTCTPSVPTGVYWFCSASPEPDASLGSLEVYVNGVELDVPPAPTVTVYWMLGAEPVYALAQEPMVMALPTEFHQREFWFRGLVAVCSIMLSTWAGVMLGSASYN